VSRLGIALVTAWVLSFAGCSSDDDPVVCPDAGAKVFGDTCAASCECSAGLECFTFGDGTTTCTPTCTTDEECPEGSQGHKCNGQGRCRT